MERKRLSPSMYVRIRAAQLKAPHGQQPLFGSRQPTFQLLLGIEPVVPPAHAVGGAHTPGGKVPSVSWWLWAARPNCFRLLLHFIRLAASRIFCTAGRS